jgi:uncharacterized membrane-anchored protein
VRASSVRLIWIGGGLLIFGAIAPFAMLMHWIESTLWLNGLSALATVFGFVCGLYGLFEYVHRERR